MKQHRGGGVALATALIVFVVGPAAAVDIQSAARDGVLPTGVSPAIRVSGLAPRETVRIHGLRVLQKWSPDSTGAWRPQSVRLHAWADLVADRRGVIDAATAKPKAGTWRKADALALFWSGAPDAKDAPSFVEAADPAGADLALFVERSGAVAAKTTIALVASSPDVAVEDVRSPTLNGAFAYRKDQGPAPLVIILHGSEGSGAQTARDTAQLFARQGFAAFALSYYARPHEAYPGVPTESVNRPVELIQAARDWAAKRPEADAARVGLRGVSKGAELALVAASRFDWIDAVVACVGSDVVWQGFGREPRPGEFMSSWSVDGAPLPYVPYLNAFDEFAAAHPGARPVDWHRASLAAVSADRVAAATIPVESIKAQTLFVAGALDEVWPSGEMSRMAARRMHDRGAPGKARTLIFEGGNHQICGPGDWPVRLYGDVKPAPGVADPVDVGHASVEGWAATLAHLKKALSAP